MGLPGGWVVRNSLATQDLQETRVQMRGSGRFPGGGPGNPLQCSCLENPKTEEPGGLQSSPKGRKAALKTEET